MNARERMLARHQLDKRLAQLSEISKLVTPARGWIKAIREALGMTSAQLAQRLGISQPGAIYTEKAEKKGTISLDALERAAHALNCRLIYTLAPKEPLEKLIEERAKLLAKQHLKTTGHSMSLEAQAVTEEDKKEQLKYLTKKLIEKGGSELWAENND